MEQAEEQRRWETAQELYRVAATACAQQHYRACAGVAYYACFQAMWVALGDPPAGQWQQVGTTRRFCHGQWTAPPSVPTQLAVLYKGVLALYELRLDAHYRAYPVQSEQARQGLRTASDVSQFVQQYKFHKETP